MKHNISAGQRLEVWLRAEPAHRSARIWINDEGGLRLTVCDDADFGGHRIIDALTLDDAVDHLEARD